MKQTFYLFLVLVSLNSFAGTFDDFKRHCAGAKEAMATEPPSQDCVGSAKAYDYDAESATLFISCESRDLGGDVEAVTLGFRCETKGAPTWKLTQKSDTVRRPTSASVIRGNHPQDESVSSPWRQPPR